MDKVILQAFLDDDSSDDELGRVLELQKNGYSLLLNNEGAAISLLQPLCDLMEKQKKGKSRENGSLYMENVVPLYSDTEFLQHFRLQRSNVKTLVSRFDETEAFEKLKGHGGLQPISAEKHILAFLWFVSHKAGGYREISDRFNMSVSSLHDVIGRVCDFIVDLSPDVIKSPNTTQQEATAGYFKTKYGVPNVIGCIGGSHIRIGKPGTDSDIYLNKNGYHSIYAQSIVNEEGKFLDVFIGYPGSTHIARVFRESPIFSSLPEFCEGENYILGDSMYPCLPNLMVPYRDNGHLTRAQKLFNEQITECLEVIDNAFRSLKRRFPQLYHFKGRDISRLVKLIHACCVLHNIASLDDLQMFDTLGLDKYISNEEESSQTTSTCPEVDFPIKNTGRKKRDEICRFINNEQKL